METNPTPEQIHNPANFSAVKSFANDIARSLRILGIDAEVRVEEVNKPPADTNVWYTRFTISAPNKGYEYSTIYSDEVAGIREGLALARKFHQPGWEDDFLNLCAHKMPKMSMHLLRMRLLKELTEFDIIYSASAEDNQEYWDSVAEEVVDMMLVADDMFRMIPPMFRGNIRSRIRSKIEKIRASQFELQEDGTYQSVKPITREEVLGFGYRDLRK